MDLRAEIDLIEAKRAQTGDAGVEQEFAAPAGQQPHHHALRGEDTVGVLHCVYDCAAGSSPKGPYNPPPRN